MRVRLDIQKIRGGVPSTGPIRVQFRIGNQTRVTSQFACLSQGAYPFFEKHNLWLQIDQSYIEVIIAAETGTLQAQITVFANKLREMNRLKMGDKQEWQVEYVNKPMGKLKQLAMRRQPSLQRSNSLQQDQGKLQILRLGLLVFNFTQRLDPLLWMWHRIESILFWKKPYLTIGCGLVLSLAIYYPKSAILLCAVGLYLGQRQIFNELSALSRYRRLHQRLIIPEENALFLQNGMDTYCQVYQQLNSVICGDDKTLLVNSILLIIRAMFISLALLLLLGIEHVLLVSLWSTLILTSPLRKGLLVHLKPVGAFVLGESSKVFEMVGKGLTTIKTVLTSSRNFEGVDESLEFYYYHYQRWWLFEGWKDEPKKYSDSDFQCFVERKEEAPLGYAWVEEWRIDFKHGEVDSEGYQYANDLKRVFSAVPVVATLRRRRWKRICQPVHSQN